mgnify:CR=1 FL=1
MCIRDRDKFVESIKTLKGVEPNLQTVYLLTNEVVEDDLKTKLDKILPLQQLAESTKQEAKIPGYLEKIVISSMRTISIPDFEIPQFGLKDVEITDTLLTDSSTMIDKTNDLVITGDLMDEAVDIDQEMVKKEAAEKGFGELPKPKTLEPQLETDDTKNLEEKTEEINESESQELEQAESSAASDLKFEDFKVDETQEKPQVVKEPKKQVSRKNDEVVVAQDSDSSDIDLSKFVSSGEATAVEPKVEAAQLKQAVKKEVLKNNDGTGSFLKVFLIGLGSFILTVAIGVGIGAGLLKLSQPSTKPADEPLVEWSESAEEADEADEDTQDSEEVAIELDRSQYSIRVVNATTKAGYAGQVANILEDQGYKVVDAKNAVESYDEGNYVMMNEEFADLIVTLSEDLEMELTYLEGTEAEDPSQEYDVIVVLAE